MVVDAALVAFVVALGGVGADDVDETRVPFLKLAGGAQQGVHREPADFYDIVDDEDFATTRSFWDQLLVSEDNAVYRAEYLAA
ncbi:MAG: hypothetical protein AAFY88_30085, partial [Acidobacteriota bacterium]